MFNYFSRLLKSRKLYIDVVISFLVLLLITSFSISLYTYRNNSKALLGLADDLVVQTSQSSIRDTIRYLEQAKTLSELGAQLVFNEADISIENPQLLYFMKWALKSYPYISAFYVGAEDGRFLQVRRLPPNPTYRGDPTQLLPGGVDYAVRFIDRRLPENITELWLYQSAAGKVIDQEKLEKVIYDHRVRDWYTPVSQSRSFKWSDIYIFNLNRHPGITAAAPVSIKGNFVGVMAVDVEIDQLSEFLKNSEIGKYGTAYIVTQKGEIVAHSDRKETAIVEGDKVRNLHLNDLKDSSIKLASQIHVDSRKDKFFFEKDGVEYLAYFASFPPQFHHQWQIGVVVPVDAFIGAAKAANMKVVLMTIVIIILSAGVVLIIARRIARPIIELAEETTKIRNFDLDNDKEIKSSIYEIQLLNDAMVSMRQSMRTFSKFIPKVLVGKLMKTGQAATIGGKARRATLLFTDVAGFTTISENYAPDKLVNHLSEYFEEVTQIIMQQNGVIDKYIGDAVMAFWGAPISDRAQALHACQAALKFQRRLIDLNRKWKFEGKPELPTRVGIHTGDVIVGNVGSSDRMNYTVLGDSVNLAARLEGVNKMYGTSIIISDDVHGEVAQHVLVRPLDVVAVKGKNKGIKIYELIGLFGDDPALLPTETQVQFANMFKHAFTLYLERRWDEAIVIFQDIAVKFGQDFTNNMYIKRCKDYKKNPPTPEWDGITHLKSK